MSVHLQTQICLLIKTVKKKSVVRQVVNLINKPDREQSTFTERGFLIDMADSQSQGLLTKNAKLSRLIT